MALTSTYSLIPKDPAGSIAKNRFRQELFWGISKIYDLFIESDDDFFVIFDCACDIEVGKQSRFHFYQLKTRDTGSKFTINQLIKQDKKTTQSILTKLFLLRINDDIESINVISNVGLSTTDSIVSSKERISFNELTAEEQKHISDHLFAETKTKPDLSYCFFERSDICIQKPEELLLGKTVKFLEKTLSQPMMNPVYLYSHLKRIVEDRASYEHSVTDLLTAIQKKGIQRSEVQEIITIISDAPRIRENVIKKIDSLSGVFSFSAIVDIKGSLNRIMKQGLESAYINLNLCKIRNYYYEQKDKKLKDMTLSEVVRVIVEDIEWDRTIDESSKKCLVIVGLTLIEEKDTKI